MSPADGNTPEETLEDAYESIRATLEAELLERVKSCSPGFFERLVVTLVDDAHAAPAEYSLDDVLSDFFRFFHRSSGSLCT